MGTGETIVGPREYVTRLHQMRCYMIIWAIGSVDQTSGKLSQVIADGALRTSVERCFDHPQGFTPMFGSDQATETDKIGGSTA